MKAALLRALLVIASQSALVTQELMVRARAVRMKTRRDQLTRVVEAMINATTPTAAGNLQAVFPLHSNKMTNAVMVSRTIPVRRSFEVVDAVAVRLRVIECTQTCHSSDAGY
jgi:hypothetical protein